MWNRLQLCQTSWSSYKIVKGILLFKMALSAITMETESGCMLSEVRGVERKEQWHVSVSLLIRARKSTLGRQTTKETTGRSPLSRWRHWENRVRAIEFEVGIILERLCFKHFSMWLYDYPAFLWLNYNILNEMRMWYTLQLQDLRAEILCCR